jgi:anaerobic selenocysteine-containing dehydrogenase
MVTVEDGLAVRIQGDPDHPFTAGFLCAKVNRYLERTDHADRLTHPMRRVGAKGEGRFERVSWDEALDDEARVRAALLTSREDALRAVEHRIAWLSTAAPTLEGGGAYRRVALRFEITTTECLE